MAIIEYWNEDNGPRWLEDRLANLLVGCNIDALAIEENEDGERYVRITLLNGPEIIMQAFGLVVDADYNPDE